MPIFCTGLLLAGCTQASHHDALNVDFIKEHYKQDPKKNSAATFLIDNLPDQVSIAPDGGIRSDSLNLSNQYFIKNLDQAFRASGTLLNSKKIRYNDFLEYVLPYKVDDGRLVSWRDSVYKNYKRDFIAKSTSTADIIDSINSINNGLSKWFQYGSFKGLEDTAGYNDILRKKKGSCTSMTNLAMYSLRAYGLPVTTDYVPCWGNLNGSHAWNVLFMDDKEYRFMGAEDSIKRFDPFSLVDYLKDERLSTHKKPSKIYRHTFSIQKNTLAYRYRNMDLLPPALSNYRIKDVTGSYIKTTTLSIPKDSVDCKNCKLLFLANYNEAGWSPVQAAEKINDQYQFGNIGYDLLYCLMSYQHKKFSIVSPPFYLSRSTTIFLRPDFSRSQQLSLSTVQSIEYDQLKIFETGSDFRNIHSPSYIALMDVAQGKNRTKPETGATYSLFYYDNGWKYLTTAKAGNGILVFNKIPGNSIFLLSKDRSKIDKASRPFMVLNGQAAWL